MHVMLSNRSALHIGVWDFPYIPILCPDAASRLWQKSKTVTQARDCLQEELKTSAVTQPLRACRIYLPPSSINYPVFLSSPADQ